jgi:hypothetical protein
MPSRHRSHFVVVAGAQVYHDVLRGHSLGSEGVLRAAPEPCLRPSHRKEHTLFLKKNIIVQGSYSSYMVLKSGTWQPALLGYGTAEDCLQRSASARL